MEPSQACFQLIRTYEGCRLAPYKDVGGRWTVGYGHLITQFEPVAAITQSQAELILDDDVTQKAAVVSRLCYGCDLTQNQFDALVSFAFNVGTNAFSGSTLLRKLKAGDIEGASREFPYWDHVGTKPEVGLLRRRRAEQELFLRPVAAST